MVRMTVSSNVEADVLLSKIVTVYPKVAVPWYVQPSAP